MFIRIKQVKQKEYAYLVSNTWRKRKKESRQKVRSYLGRVHRLEKVKNISFEEFLNCNLQDHLNKTNSNKIIKELVKKELVNYGFIESRKDIWTFKDIKINIKEKTVREIKTKKHICLEINNNFLCSYTLRKLLNFKPKEGLTKLQIGKELANSFESAGVLVPKEVFVDIARKELEKVER